MSGDTIDQALRADAGEEDFSASPVEPVRAAHSQQQQVLDLFQAHHKGLVNFLTAQLGYRHQAEDLAQRAYLNLLSVPCEGTKSFLAGYLYKTALNLAINERKKQARRREWAAQAGAVEKTHAPSPERECTAREEYELMVEALSELPYAVQLVFVLREFDDLSYEEVLQQLAVENIHIDRRTAIRYVQRALLHCQTYMETAIRRRASRETLHG